MSEKHGYDEVVDWASDVIEVQDDIRNALKDGFQLSDAFVLLQNQGKITEIVTDADDFVKELLDLSPDEADQAIAQIADRTGVEANEVNQTIVYGLQLINRAHRLVKHAWDEVQGIRDDAERFFALIRGDETAQL